MIQLNCSIEQEMAHETCKKQAQQSQSSKTNRDNSKSSTGGELQKKQVNKNLQLVNDAPAINRTQRGSFKMKGDPPMLDDPESGIQMDANQRGFHHGLCFESPDES